MESFGIRDELMLINETYSDLNNINSIYYIFEKNTRETAIDGWIEQQKLYRDFSLQGIQVSIVDGLMNFDLPENTLE